MSNFKVSDEAVCVKPFPAIGLRKGDVVVISDIKSCKCSVAICWGLPLPHPYSRCICGECKDGFSSSLMYVDVSLFERPLQIHSTRSIKNLSVVKELSRLPLVKETTEVPVRKQEGVEI